MEWNFFMQGFQASTEQVFKAMQHILFLKELVASFQDSSRCAPWPWCRPRAADESGAVRKMRGTP